MKVKNDHHSKFSNLSHLSNWKIYLQPQFKFELFHIYLSSFHYSREIWTQQIDLAPNVWLHSSVGRTSHRYRGGHRVESRWGPDFFQASSFQLLKLENLLRWSLVTFKEEVVVIKAETEKPIAAVWHVCKRWQIIQN